GNYRSACRARSHAEFTAKIGIVLDEADESELWLSGSRDVPIDTSPHVERLRQEGMELNLAILPSCHFAMSASVCEVVRHFFRDQADGVLQRSAGSEVIAGEHADNDRSARRLEHPDVVSDVGQEVAGLV